MLCSYSPILPHQAIVSAIVHFEAVWRDVVDDATQLADTELGRFDIAYETSNAGHARKSEFLTAAQVGNFEWRAQTKDILYVRAQTEKLQQLRIEGASIPAASNNIRVQMCGIAPKATLRIEKIEVILAGFSDFIEASAPLAEGSQFKCFDTGLFLTNCRLGETILDEPGNLEMEYAVGLTFGCAGHEVDFALVTDSNSIVLKPNMGTVKIRGRGLKLVDRSPAKTRAATFNPGCTLSVDRVEKMVSQEQMEALREKKAVLEADLANAKQTSQAFVDITLLARIIEALRDSLELTSKLHRSLGVAAANDVTLQELLSPFQMKTLTDMLETRNIIESSDTQYDRFKKLEHAALRKLREMSCVMKPLEENGRCHEDSI